MRKILIFIGLFIFLSSNLIYSQHKPTLFQFGAKNCIKSMFMKKVMEKVKEKYGKFIDVKIIDVYENDKTRDYIYKFNLDSVPTQILLNKEGKEIYRHEGYISFEKLEEILKAFNLI